MDALTTAAANLPPLYRLAHIQSWLERARGPENAEEKAIADFWLALAELVAEVHNAQGEPKRAVLAEAEAIVNAAEVEELGARFLDADGNEIG